MASLTVGSPTTVEFSLYDMIDCVRSRQLYVLHCIAPITPPFGTLPRRMEITRSFRWAFWGIFKDTTTYLSVDWYPTLSTLGPLLTQIWKKLAPSPEHSCSEAIHAAKKPLLVTWTHSTNIMTLYDIEQGYFIWPTLENPGSPDRRTRGNCQQGICSWWNSFQVPTVYSNCYIHQKATTQLNQVMSVTLHQPRNVYWKSFWVIFSSLIMHLHFLCCSMTLC